MLEGHYWLSRGFISTPGKISKSQLTPFISCTSRCLIQGKTLSQPPEFGGGSGFVKRQEISQVFG